MFRKDDVFPLRKAAKEWGILCWVSKKKLQKDIKNGFFLSAKQNRRQNDKNVVIKKRRGMAPK